MKPQILFDLEATCWNDNDKTRISEIIEIGAVNFDTLSEFDVFIKPTINPILSEFCTNLTSIQQADVDNGVDFVTGLNMFQDWIGTEDCELISWGSYDKKQILFECEHKNIQNNITKLLDNHVNLRLAFQDKFGLSRKKRVSMKKALSKIKEPFVGTKHRAIDDAKNMISIIKSLFY